jgi:hypothetical protein
MTTATKRLIIERFLGFQPAAREPAPVPKSEAGHDRLHHRPVRRCSKDKEDSLEDVLPVDGGARLPGEQVIPDKTRKGNESCTAEGQANYSQTPGKAGPLPRSPYGEWEKGKSPEPVKRHQRLQRRHSAPGPTKTPLSEKGIFEIPRQAADPEQSKGGTGPRQYQCQVSSLERHRLISLQMSSPYPKPVGGTVLCIGSLMAQSP